MSTRTTAAIIFLCVVISGMFLSNLLVTMMIGEINRKRQEGDLISYLGFTTFATMLEIFREYRRLYPGGKLHIYALASFAVAMIALIGVAVCLHIIG